MTEKALKKSGTTIPLLTSREKEVLHLLIDGKTCKEVAECLFISYETVRTHRRNLYLKLDVKTAVQLGAIGCQYLHDKKSHIIQTNTFRY